MGIACRSVKHFPLADVWKKKKKKERKMFQKNLRTISKRKNRHSLVQPFDGMKMQLPFSLFFFHLVQQSKPIAHVVFQISGKQQEELTICGSCVSSVGINLVVSLFVFLKTG